MNSKMTITIRRRSQPEWLIWLVILMPFLFGTLFDLMALLELLKYLLDFSWVCLLLFLFLKYSRNTDVVKKYKVLYVWIFAFLVYTLLIYAFNYQSMLYYLWGLRNNFRFYVFFFACITFLKQKDIEYYLTLFDKLFWINAAVSFIQFFVFGISGDNLGGLFGVETGCNSYTNLFFIVAAAKTIIFYLNKKEKLGACIVKSCIMMLIAALAELKFFYAEFVIIVAAAALLTEFSWRKLIIVVGAAGAVLLGAYVLVLVFPNSADMLTLEGLLDTASSEAGYTSSGDINRLTSISIISNRFLTTLQDRLFGLGLGNCDGAGFDFLNSPFFIRYSDLRYQWFSLAFLFLETGYVGLCFYFGFFVLAFVEGRKTATATLQDKVYKQISAIVAISCVLISVYNSSLRTEAGYLAYFVLALPFIRSEREINVAAA